MDIPIGGLVTALMLWISGVSGLPVVDTPNVVYMDQDKLTCFAFTGDTDCAHSNYSIVRGSYDYETHTVYLTNDWDYSNKEDQGTLVHEIVHSMQTHGDGVCSGAIELEAYTIEAEYRGIALDDLLDPLTRMLLARCE